MGNRGIGAVLAACALLIGLLSSGVAQAGDKWIYLQRTDEGLRSYSDAKPPKGKYTRVKMSGRATATASCMGLTPVKMQERASLYETHIHRYATDNGLPPQLVSAVMRVESCQKKHAVSRAGARGLMQLMPATARELGVGDSFDPEQNIQGGTLYLARMMKRFGNDVKLALAAYNAGPEAVDAYKGVPPFAETKSYVTRILKLYQPQA